MLELVRSVPFGTPQATAAGATVTLHRAGHVLGSASVLVSIGGRSVLFSGDLGRPRHPLLQPRADPPPAHAVVLESTYGNRIHPHLVGMDEHEPLAAAIRRTIGRGGSVLIPAFAVDRTELVLLALARLTAQQRIPHVPIHVDSPMALAALDVYQRRWRRDAAEPLEELLSMTNVHEAKTPDESRRLNTPGTPSIIVSASGMATGGRVVHHLESLLPHADNTVVLSGYQAVGTRGGRCRTVLARSSSWVVTSGSEPTWSWTTRSRSTQPPTSWCPGWTGCPARRRSSIWSTASPRHANPSLSASVSQSTAP